jgi:hypothetical protein
MEDRSMGLISNISKELAIELQQELKTTWDKKHISKVLIKHHLL